MGSIELGQLVGNFSAGFNIPKDASVLTTFEVHFSEGFRKIMHLYQQNYRLETDCQVCFTPQNTQVNLISYCEKCSVSFHQHCYGIEESVTVCDVCRRQEKGQKCYFCCKKYSHQLPLKFSKGIFFHVTCFVANNQLHLYNCRPLAVSRKTLAEIVPTKEECNICQKSQGLKYQCRECPLQYHLLCAYLNGLEVEFSYDEKKRSKQVSLQVSCPWHNQTLSQLQ